MRWLTAILGVAGVIAGCAPGPTGTPVISNAEPPGSEWIVALTGTVGAMSLVAPDSAGGLTVAGGGLPSVLPANAAWLSSDGLALVATTLDGRAMVGSAGSPITWQAPLGDLAEPHPFRAFGSLEPGGAHGIAFVEGDPGVGTPGRLVVESQVGTVLRVVPLTAAAESPVAWLPDGRIAVIARDRNDLLETLLVDAGGRTSRVSGAPFRSIAIAGHVVAVIDEAGALRAGTVSAWLGGASLQEVAAADPGEAAIQAQPSPSGSRLAVVVANAEGDASSIRVLAATGGWHEIARFGLPDGANRAVVSWLAAP